MQVFLPWDLLIVYLQAVFPNYYSFLKQPEFCVVLDKVRRSCRGDRRESLAQAQPRICPLMDQVEATKTTCADIQVRLSILSLSPSLVVRVVAVGPE